MNRELIHLKYRFNLHQGDQLEAAIAGKFDAYSKIYIGYKKYKISNPQILPSKNPQNNSTGKCLPRYHLDHPISGLLPQMIIANVWLISQRAKPV
ncbi:hypothetical protein [uncultured Cyclobacterium sp.]|uniref:hypothetical protein n=1 Tax=uncultured Cyclobacterium sp. TaxID=453820 RepID=UPI0030EF9FBF